MQRLEADYKAVTDKEKAEVVQLGGLHVVGTERHVSPTSCFISSVSGKETLHAHCYHFLTSHYTLLYYWMQVRCLSVPSQESRRIDNQLRGRSGRQGDPGSTRFFLSLEDK